MKSRRRHASTLKFRSGQWVSWCSCGFTTRPHNRSEMAEREYERHVEREERAAKRPSA